jgi:protein-L-isoaspartate(D-aspartate) O-methyltransferase
MRFEDQRKWMVEQQLKLRGISAENVLHAFLTVERHLFVPLELRHFSYEDTPLTIGEGQTISQPYTVAFMLQLADLKSEHRVLEIGTGSGYQTALLATITNEVYTIERIPALIKRAQNVLAELNLRNVKYQVGDGTLGWKAEELFDRIIVTAGAPEVPSSLMNQLKTGGKMVIPLGDKWTQNMTCYIKTEQSFHKEEHGTFRFVPLIGKEGWKI